MIFGAVFSPCAPVLVPELGGQATADMAELRSAIAQAIRTLLNMRTERLLVIGETDAAGDSRMHAATEWGSFAGFGVAQHVSLGAERCEGEPTLPASLCVGAYLLAEVAGVGGRAIGPDEVLGVSVGADFAGSAVATQVCELVAEHNVGLLVLGEGSARRSRSSPGYFDPRASAFDAALDDALASGRPETLGGIDLVLAQQVQAEGASALVVAAELMLGSSYQATLEYAAEPFGVHYVVSSWTHAVDGQ